MDSIIEGTYETKEQQEQELDIYDSFFSGYSAKSYGGSNGEEVKYIKSCETILAAISKYMGMDMSGSTTLQFYQAKAMADEEAKSYKK